MIHRRAVRSFAELLGIGLAFCSLLLLTPHGWASTGKATDHQPLYHANELLPLNAGNEDSTQFCYRQVQSLDQTLLAGKYVGHQFDGSYCEVGVDYGLSKDDPFVEIKMTFSDPELGPEAKDSDNTPYKFRFGKQTSKGDFSAFVNEQRLSLTRLVKPSEDRPFSSFDQVSISYNELSQVEYFWIFVADRAPAKRPAATCYIVSFIPDLKVMESEDTNNETP